MEGQATFSVFIALNVPGQTGCHITVAIATGITQNTKEEIEAKFKNLFEACCSPGGGLLFQIGNYKKVDQLEMYECRPKDTHIHKLLKTFYREHYTIEEDVRMFPDLKMHITVDTIHRRNEIENMIRSKHHMFIVTDYFFDTKEPKDWVCGVCAFTNFGCTKECKVCKKPKQKKIKNIPSPKKTWYYDWDCPHCKQPAQFGSRDRCSKCGGPRPESAASRNFY